MNRRIGVFAGMILLALAISARPMFATESELYFSSDRNGQHRVTNIQEGDEIWIAVIDSDQNIDCDIRDKMSPDLKILDPKTGAYIVWNRNVDFDSENILPDDDYLEETGADTGVFTSVRAFHVGTRESFSALEPWKHVHVVDVPVDGVLNEFQWGHWIYASADDPPVPYSDERVWLWYGEELIEAPGPDVGATADVPSNQWDIDLFDYIIGRFENMDTLIGMYQDPNDATDVSVAMMKIIDTEATISWDREIYKDANGSAAITVVDPDENLNCNEVEFVPVYILVNPGSWNPVEEPDSPTNFCALLRTGGVAPDGTLGGRYWPIRWYNIYDSYWNGPGSLYYIRYDIDQFATISANGTTPVLFYAQETGVNTGVFQLNLNSILIDLEFEALNVRDVLVAYYLDPNDFDDFKLATAYIEERQHSTTSFTDVARTEQDLYWIGRDSVYVQVIDANANVDPCCPERVVVQICDPHGDDDSEFVILDEVSSNSPVFLTHAGVQLWPVWDALGVGLADSRGGFQLQLDNWKLEAFNEDDVYARYNDVRYGTDDDGLPGLGDVDIAFGVIGAFPPWIDQVRVANDVSFDLMSIADTQVYDGSSANMYFLDRQGSRVSGYMNSDCVFIEVIDPDQDEDQYRRERIDGYWDGGQNTPFGPQALNEFGCDFDPECEHGVNALLGDTDIFNGSPVDSLDGVCHQGLHAEPVGWAKLYVLNPRNGRWAAVDLLETGTATGIFVSAICIDLTNVYECVPTLAVLPGDTIVAFYQDPSNHSDSAMISIKVGIGGGGVPPSQQSSTAFVDEDGNDVVSYSDADRVYVKVNDPSQAASSLAGALTVDGYAFDLIAVGDVSGRFMTEAIDLALNAGDEITAIYVDPTNPLDTSSDTIGVVASMLDIESFVASPNPFEIDVTVSYVGTGIASIMTLSIYDLSGRSVKDLVATHATEIVWDGTKGMRCSPLANGAYIYVVTATDGTNTFSQTGKVFIHR